MANYHEQKVGVMIAVSLGLYNKIAQIIEM